MSRTGDKKFAGFRVFPTGVALVLTEVVFWIVVGIVWYGVQQIAPNVQWGRLNWAPLVACNSRFSRLVYLVIQPQESLGEKTR